MDFWTPKEPLSAAELDRRLEKAVLDNERSERLICIYLHQIKRRGHYRHFGFENVYDYAHERFGFCRSKTSTLLYLGLRLSKLPSLTEALAKGRIGWTKAAKVARAATPANEAELTEEAIASSYKELEDRLRDGTSPGGGRVSIWLNAEQMSVWAQALEICRRVCGEQVDTGLALEYIAGEFLATYAAPTEALDSDEASAEGEDVEVEGDVEGEGEGEGEVESEAPAGPDSTQEIDSTPAIPDTLTGELDPKVEALLCPDNDDLPSVEAKCYAAIHKLVLERDGYRCQYPGCRVRHGLHVHHIELRSHFGRKSWASMNDPSNLIVLCYFHHRMLHAGIIGLEGKAPGELRWRRPKIMETATERHERLSPLDDSELSLEEEILSFVPKLA